MGGFLQLKTRGFRVNQTVRYKDDSRNSEVGILKIMAINENGMVKLENDGVELETMSPVDELIPPPTRQVTLGRRRLTNLTGFEKLVKEVQEACAAAGTELPQ